VNKSQEEGIVAKPRSRKRARLIKAQTDEDGRFFVICSEDECAEQSAPFATPKEASIGAPITELPTSAAAIARRPHPSRSNRSFWSYLFPSLSIHHTTGPNTFEHLCLTLQDMCKIMRELVVSSSSTEELSVEERNLLSVAYKNVIGSRRAAWRTLNAGVDEGKFDDLLLAYRKQVESELSDVCLDVLDLLENTLVKHNQKENEARVFYLKVSIRKNLNCWKSEV
jgi:hypothetical protein